MKISKLRMTAHVFRRLAQRGISLANVQVTLKYGRRIHRAHACFVFMAKKDVPLGQERQFDSIIGTTVVVEDDCIVTCYKNKRVLARLRRKPKKYHGYPSEQRITGYMTGTQRMAV